MIDDIPGGTRLRLLIQPNASKNLLIGPHNGAFKVKIQAPPIEGRANDELIEFMAEVLSLPKKSLRISKGETGRNKTLLIDGIGAQEIKKRLGL